MAADQKQEYPKGCADDLLRSVCEELVAVGCRASFGSMAPMEDLHGRIAAYLDKAKTDATRAQFSAVDMADQGAKQFREGMAAGIDKALANVRAHLPTRVETEKLGDYSPEECAAYDAGYNDALTRAHNLLSRRPGSLAVADGDALDRLARQIADNAARADIEIYAQCVYVDCVLFLDTTKPSRGSGDPVKALEYVRNAVDYIDLRGDAFDWHMQRHISAPHLVRFVDKVEASA